MIESENNQNIISSNVMDKKFNKRARLKGYLGNALRKGEYTKSYKNYVKENPTALLKQGDIRYLKSKKSRKFIFKRSELEDKRSKDGRLKKVVSKQLAKDLPLQFQQQANIKYNTSLNGSTGTRKLTLSRLTTPFLSESGKEQIINHLAYLIGKSRTYFNVSSLPVFVEMNGTNTNELGEKVFRVKFNSNPILRVVETFIEGTNSGAENRWMGWDNFIQNFIDLSSSGEIVINDITFYITYPENSVGDSLGSKNQIIKLPDEKIRIRDYASKGVNNCFFWTVQDWIKKTGVKRITPKYCNLIRKKYGIPKDSKISYKNIVLICEKEFSKKVGILNQTNIVEHNSTPIDPNVHRYFFCMREHIFLYEGVYKQTTCPKCGTKYFLKHSKSDCKKKQCYLKKERYVLPQKRLKGVKGNKIPSDTTVLHYDIETHTNNDDKEHQAYIVGFTYYSGNDWVYKEIAGEKCMEQFFDFLNKKLPTNVKYLNAYNGNRFDHFWLARILYKKKSMKPKHLLNNGALLSLEWVTERVGDNEKPLLLKTIDLNRHLLGSLASNLKQNNCNIAKGDIDHNLSVAWEDTTEDRKKQVREYLECDVLGLRELYEKFNSDCVENFGCNLCDFVTGSQMCYDLWRTHFLKSDYIVELPNSRLDTFIRRSIYGGRCYVNKRKFKSKQYDQIINGEIGFDDIDDFYVDADVVSLYPHSMKMDFPIGIHKTSNKLEYDEDGKLKMGIYHIKYISNKNLLIPCLPRREDKSLKWDLYDSQGVYTTIDIQRALDNGYKIEVSGEGGIYWDEKAPIFSDYIDYFYKKKQESKKGTPAYATAKVNLNALYGKQLQRPIYDQQETVSNHCQMLEILAKGYISDIVEMDNNNWIVSYTPLDSNVIDNQIKKPSQNGAFILSYSRDVMWQYFEQSKGLYNMDDLFAYTDTDSIQLHNNSAKNLKWGNKLGDIDNDLGDGAKIIRGIWVQPKLYMLEYVKKEDYPKKHHHFRGAGLNLDKLDEDVFQTLHKGQDILKISPDFQIKKNAINKKIRRISNGKVKNCQSKYFTLYHITNEDRDVFENKVLEKKVGGKMWAGRQFEGNVSYPFGFKS